MTTLLLVSCEPYATRLTVTACSDRFRRAQRAGDPLRRTACRTCPAGQARAQEAPKEAHRYERVEDLATRTDEDGRLLAAVRCTCGRSPVKWVPAQRWRSYARAGCKVCGREKQRRPQVQGRYDFEELVALDQRARVARGGRR